jgi:hypothetical protein
MTLSADIIFRHTAHGMLARAKVSIPAIAASQA